MLHVEKLYATVSDMPRERSDNSVAINMKIPPAWIVLADKLVALEDGLAEATRTAIFRAALGRGLELLLKQKRKKRRVSKRLVSGAA